MSNILKPNMQIAIPVCEVAIQEQIFFTLFSFVAIKAHRIAVIIPNIFKTSKTAGVKLRRGYNRRSRNTPVARIAGLVIIENIGFGASEDSEIFVQNGNCAHFINAPIINKIQISEKNSGFKLANEYNPSELILLYPKVGILTVSGVRVEKYKNAIDAMSSI